jgi:hypothetical protein
MTGFSLIAIGRPTASEYGEHAAKDIARVAGDDAIDALLQQQREFDRAIDNAPPAWKLARRDIPRISKASKTLGSSSITSRF